MGLRLFIFMWRFICRHNLQWKYSGFLSLILHLKAINFSRFLWESGTISRISIPRHEIHSVLWFYQMSEKVFKCLKVVSEIVRMVIVSKRPYTWMSGKSVCFYIWVYVCMCVVWGWLGVGVEEFPEQRRSHPILTGP